jgi:hypothetical protein
MLRSPVGLILLALLAALGLQAAPRAEPPSLDVVLARSAKYVDLLHAQLSGIVAEETYVQEVKAAASAEASTGSRHRTLRSDLLLLKPAALPRYVEYRDVFEVDGVAIRDRQERLTALFLEPGKTSEERLRAIVSESARHNIGIIPRNINTPMLALSFLRAELQPRFRFRQVRGTAPQLRSALQHDADLAVFRVTSEMWCVEFRETKRPSVIRTNDGRDFLARGRFWIDPASGVVLISELDMNNGAVSGTINVSYQSEPLLGFQVPVEMRERYAADATVIEGNATYGRFRRFEVTTREVIGKPPGIR